MKLPKIFTSAGTLGAVLASSVAMAAPSVGDTFWNAGKASTKSRELAVCLWETNRPAALRMAAEASAVWKKDSFAQFHIAPDSFGKCGGSEAVSYAINNIDAIGADLHLIRVNQMARCITHEKGVAVDSIVTQVERELAARQPVMASVKNRNVKLLSAFLQAGVTLPEPLKKAAGECDQECAVWADTDGDARMLLMDELVYEAKRNA
ncbi:hypothetical protein [Sphingobium amiense]|uniref:hypothetical protein n=1 Tax=Sphingobium amiense TaxID=135719 RepID=UPI000A6F28E5|nr:hypothetical protein [Sphingobium amiense]